MAAPPPPPPPAAVKPAAVKPAVVVGSASEEEQTQAQGPKLETMAASRDSEPAPAKPKVDAAVASLAAAAVASPTHPREAGDRNEQQGQDPEGRRREVPSPFQGCELGASPFPRPRRLGRGSDPTAFQASKPWSSGCNESPLQAASVHERKRTFLKPLFGELP